MDSLQIRFWGTRGIISSPRKNTEKYGGNTTCMQIIGSKDIIVIDTGFGASLLGESLQPIITEGGQALKIHILYTHFHWDHTQGLPFFHPIYFPSSEINIYSPYSHKKIFDNLDILFDGSYSPFEGIKSMPSNICLHSLKSNKVLEIGDLCISFVPLNHSVDKYKDENPTFAYKIDSGAKSIVVATDHDPGATDGDYNERLITFARSADILVHDAQLFSKDKDITSWGHATTKEALDNAEAAQAKFTILTHHDPQRLDKEIDQEFELLKKKYKRLSFEFARENYIYTA